MGLSRRGCPSDCAPPDYEGQLPNMLNVVQETLSGNPHYLGWAWHSYNDAPQAAR